MDEVLREAIGRWQGKALPERVKEQLTAELEEENKLGCLLFGVGREFRITENFVKVYGQTSHGRVVAGLIPRTRIKKIFEEMRADWRQEDIDEGQPEEGKGNSDPIEILSKKFSKILAQTQSSKSGRQAVAAVTPQGVKADRHSATLMGVLPDGSSCEIILSKSVAVTAAVAILEKLGEESK